MAVVKTYNTADLANIYPWSRVAGALAANAVAPPTPTPTAMPTGGGSAVNPFQSVVDALKGFNINPSPQPGQGPYGKVPGPIAYPTTPYQEATKIYPGLEELKGLAGDEIRSQILGEFTPQEENALWDTANRFGVASGMPGSQLWSNKFMGNRIEEGARRRQMGVQNYQTLLNELSRMGVDPALAAEIAARNANMGAAPDPEAAANELLRRFAEGLNQLGRVGSSGFGGGGGGFGMPFMNPAMGTVPKAPSNAGFPFNPPGTTGTLGGSSTIYDNNDWANLFDPSAGTNLWGNTPQGTPMGSPSLSYDSPWLSTPVDTGGLFGGYGTPSLGYDSPWGGYQDTSFGSPTLSYDNPAWGGLGATDPTAGGLFGELFLDDFEDDSYWDDYFEEYGY